MNSHYRDGQIQAILHAYLQALDRGEQPDRQALLDAHPDLRAELTDYFADASKLERLAQSLKTVAFSGAGFPACQTTADRNVSPTIRYFGDYELLEEIAHGGMGVVFKARQVSLNRIVALKMILKGELATEADVRRFRQEAEAAANLDHPNIVPIYEVGEYEGQQYFSMKLIEVGQAFEPANPSAGWKACPTAASLLAKIARAVHHAHQRGILHRDLKPSNILIDRDGEPHVADFGLAKKVEGSEDATLPGTILGTPAYMPPEQARAEKALTTSVDVYSLGAILYEWLTGQPPFRGANRLATLQQVINDEPAKPRAINARIDRDLETICLKCLEKQPAKRYPSAEALADDLDRWQRGEPITARPATRAERLWRWAKREPKLAAASGIVTLLLVLIAVVMGISAQRQSNLRAEADRKADLARRRLYVANMNLAQRAWEAAHIPNLKHYLERTSPEHTDGQDLRGFEWYYFRRLLDAPFTLKGNAGDVTCVAFRPDGKSLVSGGKEQTKVWDALSGVASLAHPRPAGEFWQDVAISPDGMRVVRQGRNAMFQVCATQGGQKISTFQDQDDGEPGCVAFSANGTRIATGGHDKPIKIWDAGTGNTTVTIQGRLGRVNCLAFSPNGKHLVGGCGSALKMWDTETGKQLLSFFAHRHWVTCVTFSHDGQWLASAGEDYRLKIWDAATGKELDSRPAHTAWIYAVVFSPDDKRLVTCSADRTIKIW